MSPAAPSVRARRSPQGLAVADSAPGLVGGTALVRLARISPARGATVWGKAEHQNPGGSVKDRPALAMMVAAEADGSLRPGSSVVEATSGNTGISLAMLSAMRGYRCVLVMPEDMSMTRRQVLRSYGAEVVLTPAAQGMGGAVRRALELEAELEGAWMPRQFQNPANPAVHEATTGPELFEQLDGSVSAFVAGVGTGGTFTGVGRALRSRLGAGVRLVAVEPAASPVLSGGQPGLHGIQGLGAGFVPEVLDRSLIDEIITVSDVAADKMARRLAREEGLLVGPSAGANVWAAAQLAGRLPGGNVVTILCDSGERYLY